jgi:uncharacterized membrane protein YvlD (DUF360 family)
MNWAFMFLVVVSIALLPVVYIIDNPIILLIYGLFLLIVFTIGTQRFVLSYKSFLQKENTIVSNSNIKINQK